MDTQLAPQRPDVAETPKRKSRVGWFVGVGIAASLAVAGIGWAATQDSVEAVDSGVINPPPTRFETAYANATPGSAIVLADDGAAIIIDGKSDDYYAYRGALQDRFYENIATILTSLDTPDYVINQMDATTSLQGVVTASWDGIEASWTYHPDNGFDLQLVDTQLASAV